MAKLAALPDHVTANRFEKDASRRRAARYVER